MSMTRQEQLDAVVRNYGSWNAGFNNGVAFWIGSIEDVGYTDSYNIHATNFPAFTRAEVEQRKAELRKAELQNKPSWSDAPEWAGFLSQDGNGAWFWNEILPDIMEIGFLSPAGRLMSSVSGQVIGDWRDTLEKRPEPEVTPEEEEAFKDMENAKLNSGETLEDAINNTVKALGLDAGWDGEGLPPAGSDCFLLLGVDDFGKCKITYMGDGVFCYRQYKSGKEYAASWNDALFRPIKSDREKWVEAAMNGLSYAVDEHPEDMIGMIHDAMASGQLQAPEVK